MTVHGACAPSRSVLWTAFLGLMPAFLVRCNKIAVLYLAEDSEPS
jgi:hypothetical protein